MIQESCAGSARRQFSYPAATTTSIVLVAHTGIVFAPSLPNAANPMSFAVRRTESITEKLCVPKSIINFVTGNSIVYFIRHQPDNSFSFYLTHKIMYCVGTTRQTHVRWVPRQNIKTTVFWSHADRLFDQTLIALSRGIVKRSSIVCKVLLD